MKIQLKDNAVVVCNAASDNTQELGIIGECFTDKGPSLFKEH